MEMNHLPRLVSSQSALRRIPLHVHSEDKVVLDGIRYALEIADRAYCRLRETLWQISSDKKSDHVENYVDLVADTWTVVDSFNRLYVLCLTGCSYLDHDYVREHAEALRPIVKLRNANQHINGRLEKIVADKESAWGAISWTVCNKNTATHGESHCFVAGALRTVDLLLPEPPTRSFHMPVDGITARADNTEVSISDLMLLSAQFAGQLDADLSKRFPLDAPHVRDAHVVGEFRFNDTGVRSPRFTLAVIHENATPLNRAARRRIDKQK
jgi:hypothetical protein